MMRPYGSEAIAWSDLLASRCPRNMPCHDACELPVSALDSTTLALLSEVYANDFALFGYDREVLTDAEGSPGRGRLFSRAPGEKELIGVFGDEMVSAFDLGTGESSANA